MMQNKCGRKRSFPGNRLEVLKNAKKTEDSHLVPPTRSEPATFRKLVNTRTLKINLPGFQNVSEFFNDFAYVYFQLHSCCALSQKFIILSNGLGPDSSCVQDGLKIILSKNRTLQRNMSPHTFFGVKDDVDKECCIKVP